MSEEFDTRAALGRLKLILEKYESESLDFYTEETYISDILFFLGKSVDKDKYGYDAKTYVDFLATLHPRTEAARKSIKNRFARSLGMRT
mgnify:CR=1 FL=1